MKATSTMCNESIQVMSNLRVNTLWFFLSIHLPRCPALRGLPWWRRTTSCHQDITTYIWPIGMQSLTIFRESGIIINIGNNFTAMLSFPPHRSHVILIYLRNYLNISQEDLAFLCQMLKLSLTRSTHHWDSIQGSLTRPGYKIWPLPRFQRRHVSYHLSIASVPFGNFWFAVWHEGWYSPSSHPRPTLEGMM